MPSSRRIMTRKFSGSRGSEGTLMVKNNHEDEGTVSRKRQAIKRGDVTRQKKRASDSADDGCGLKNVKKLKKIAEEQFRNGDGVEKDGPDNSILEQPLLSTNNDVTILSLTKTDDNRDLKTMKKLKKQPQVASRGSRDNDGVETDEPEEVNSTPEKKILTTNNEQSWTIEQRLVAERLRLDHWIAQGTRAMQASHIQAEIALIEKFRHESQLFYQRAQETYIATQVTVSHLVSNGRLTPNTNYITPPPQAAFPMPAIDARLLEARRNVLLEPFTFRYIGCERSTPGGLGLETTTIAMTVEPDLTAPGAGDVGICNADPPDDEHIANGEVVGSN